MTTTSPDYFRAITSTADSLLDGLMAPMAGLRLAERLAAESVRLRRALFL